MVVLAKPPAPEMLLLKVYQDQAVTGWLMSEKLDGVRALWDGKQLRFRSGQLILAPEWFLAGLPKFALDGELWTKRNDFENIVSIVRQQQPDQRWQEITYNIFEVPNQAGGLLQRLSILEGYLQKRDVPYLHIIPEVKIQSDHHFRVEMERLLGLGAEGLVLRQPNQSYVTGRHSSALK
ncbi:DNA ligase [Hydrogenovibrio sp. SC-1]|uniref:DNA ligase n=1 Tax=Hydrogenovibrio sp. SC-1 TaxID=2065820 RepID=UPI001E338AC8|nr:DNA ligase [Hydrogenovibrio sp. SC-1]